MVILYYALPFDRKLAADAVVLLLVLLIAFVAITVMQVRAIISSKTPVLRAIEGLGVAIPLLLLSFSLTYFLMARESSQDFSQALTRTDSIYFTTTVFATVGFGDIVPVSETARLIVTGQMLIDLAVLGIGIRVILQAVQRSRSRSENADETT